MHKNEDHITWSPVLSPVYTVHHDMNSAEFASYDPLDSCFCSCSCFGSCCLSSFSELSSQQTNTSKQNIPTTTAAISSLSTTTTHPRPSQWPPKILYSIPHDSHTRFHTTSTFLNKQCHHTSITACTFHILNISTSCHPLYHEHFYLPHHNKIKAQSILTSRQVSQQYKIHAADVPPGSPFYLLHNHPTSEGNQRRQ